jgi:hypothetical protein
LSTILPYYILLVTKPTCARQINIEKAYPVWYCLYEMNDIQAKIAELEAKKWTLAALADEMGVTPNAVEKWKAGDRYPTNVKAVLILMDEISKTKQAPKQRRYGKR